MDFVFRCFVTHVSMVHIPRDLALIYKICTHKENCHRSRLFSSSDTRAPSYLLNELFAHRLNRKTPQPRCFGGETIGTRSICQPLIILCSLRNSKSVIPIRNSAETKPNYIAGQYQEYPKLEPVELPSIPCTIESREIHHLPLVS